MEKYENTWVLIIIHTQSLKSRFCTTQQKKSKISLKIFYLKFSLLKLRRFSFCLNKVDFQIVLQTIFIMKKQFLCKFITILATLLLINVHGKQFLKQLA